MLEFLVLAVTWLQGSISYGYVATTIVLAMLSRACFVICPEITILVIWNFSLIKTKDNNRRQNLDTYEATYRCWLHKNNILAKSWQYSCCLFNPIFVDTKFLVNTRLWCLFVVYLFLAWIFQENSWINVQLDPRSPKMGTPQNKV